MNQNSTFLSDRMWKWVRRGLGVLLLLSWAGLYLYGKFHHTSMPSEDRPFHSGADLEGYAIAVILVLLMVIGALAYAGTLAIRGTPMRISSLVLFCGLQTWFFLSGAAHDMPAFGQPAFWKMMAVYLIPFGVPVLEMCLPPWKWPRRTVYTGSLFLQ